MSQPPKKILSLTGFWAHFIGLPLFVLGLLLLFFPYGFRNLAVTFSRYSFHITMTFCIIVVVMLISRLSTLFIHKKMPLTRSQYLVLCGGEILFSSGFTSLYLWLFTGKTEAYFMYFGYVLVYLAVAMTIPYIIIFQYFLLQDREEQLQDADRLAQGEKVRFCDERGNVRLIVSQPSILYIQSEENYLRIYYLDEGKLNTYLLRSSMKRIEETCAKSGLVRCHRSYFVNKNRVKVLQKDKEFTYAILDVPNTAHIPVSKNYYDQISAML